MHGSPEPSQPNNSLPKPQGSKQRSGDPDREDCRVYGLDFWLSYLANASLMTAISVLFRYADFVSQLGGNERQLGSIVGVGMIGALSMRMFLGGGIDRYGPRRIWLASLAMFTLATLAHLTIHSLQTPSVYILRIAIMTGVAGALGSSLTYVSLRVGEGRIAEVVGTLGTSGFVGLAIGPMLGDWLFGHGSVTRLHVDQMFSLAGVLGIASLLAAMMATRKEVRPTLSRCEMSLWQLVRRYHPGVLLVVSAAMGLGVGLPSVFLRPFTISRHIDGIRTFFLVYAIVAFSVRMCTRRLTERIGIRPVILGGLAAQTASTILYLTVHTAWQLALPAIAAGVAHALLFPAIVAGGSISFPPRYRGLATSLVLAMFDVGNLIGQPAIGNILYYAQQWDWPQYPTMFASVACVLTLIAGLYARRTFSPAGRSAHSPSSLAQPAREESPNVR